MNQQYDETIDLKLRHWPEGLKQPEGCPCGWEEDGDVVHFTLRRGCPVHRAILPAPPRPKEWYDEVPDGVLAVVVEHGRIWHKNCPKDNHASGIMGKISPHGADGLARIKCYSCEAQAFLPRGEGRIRLTEIRSICEEHS